MKLFKPKFILTTSITQFFRFEQLATTYRTEVLAGVTTFMTMAYILVVNPRILSNAIYLTQPGDLFNQLLFTTAISSAIATALMGVLANYPFALAPAMGLNAFFAFSVVLDLQMNWRLALTSVLIESLIFTSLILCNIHVQIIKAIPASLKHATVAGIGLFIAYIGLSGVPEAPTLGAGIIVASKATLTTIGSFRQPATLLSAFGLLLTAALVARHIKGAILWGIFATALLGWILGIAPSPEKIIALPEWPKDLINQAFTGWSYFTPKQIWNFLSVTLTFLFVTSFDTIGALTGLGQQAGYINENGELPRATKSLLANAVGTTFGSFMGTSPCATYLESAAGISEGGRSGFTSVIVAALFLLSVLFTPLFAAVPAFATAPALIMVGFLMMSSVQNINWKDPAEAIPAFLILLTMPLTYSIAEALAIGFIIYPLIKIFQGLADRVSKTAYTLAAISVFHFVLRS
ncbi:NCS2 family permease [Phormidium sp. LEGE 05292]|uniref:NCS2 family permease n=1 Tax=[Phormidium] sp. LEGE 05292 TaxID=767427 RepID=UPI00188077F4|nr:NCS2 family permease [Phormidium sp. LEGE 05292]MBE9227687.1 NCS2 family permease [Phormidium sp. LEGE 05292]